MILVVGRINVLTIPAGWEGNLCAKLPAVCRELVVVVLSVAIH